MCGRCGRRCGDGERTTDKWPFSEETIAISTKVTTGNGEWFEAGRGLPAEGASFGWYCPHCRALLHLDQHQTRDVGRLRRMVVDPG
jgi:hypothetical protein